MTTLYLACIFVGYSTLGIFQKEKKKVDRSSVSSNPKHPEIRGF